MKVLGPGHTRGKPVPFRPDGTSCDSCSEEARHLVVTEADSFGAEAAHLCTTHYLEFNHALEESRAEMSLCELCHTVTTDVRPTRDPEEGIGGRLYDACPDCRRKIYSQDPSEGEPPANLDDFDIEEFLPENDNDDFDDDFFPEDDTHETTPL